MEGFLYLCLVQDGVGGTLHGRWVLAAQAWTDVAMALGFCRGAERVGRLLYHLGEVVPGADTEVGIVVDAALGVGVSGEWVFIHPLRALRSSPCLRGTKKTGNGKREEFL